MRIDAYNNIGMVYKTTAKTQVKKNNKTSQAEDRVEISQAGRDYQTAKTAVKAASDVREDVIAAVKAKYKGNYDISNEELAAKLADKISSALF